MKPVFYLFVRPNLRVFLRRLKGAVSQSVDEQTCGQIACLESHGTSKGGTELTSLAAHAAQPVCILAKAYDTPRICTVPLRHVWEREAYPIAHHYGEDQAAPVGPRKGVDLGGGQSKEVLKESVQVWHDAQEPLWGRIFGLG